MTRSRFIRLSGWGLTLAAVCLLLTFLPDTAWPPGPRTWPFFGAIVLVTLGLLGLGVRHGARAGSLARAALGVGMVGGVVGAAANLLWAGGFAGGRPLMNAALAVMFAGLLGFGVAAWRAGLKPRDSGWPILAGLWWPAIWLISQVYSATAGRGPEAPGWLSLTLFLGMNVGLAGLGRELRAGAPSVNSPPPTKGPSHD